MEAISKIPPLKQRINHSSSIEAEITTSARPYCFIFPLGVRSYGNNNIDNNDLGDVNHDKNSNTTDDVETVENIDNRYYGYSSTYNNHTVKHNPPHDGYSEQTGPVNMCSMCSCLDNNRCNTAKHDNANYNINIEHVLLSQ